MKLDPSPPPSQKYLIIMFDAADAVTWSAVQGAVGLQYQILTLDRLKHSFIIHHVQEGLCVFPVP